MDNHKHKLFLCQEKSFRCQIRFKSEPFLVDLKFKSEHLKSGMISPKRRSISWRNGITSLSRSTRLREISADNEQHYFRGASKNRMDPGIPEETRDGILFHVAIAAVELHALTHHAVEHLRDPVLGHRYLLDDILPLHMFDDQAVEEGASQFHFRRHFGHLKGDVLETANGPTEDLPTFCIVDGKFQGLFRSRLGADGAHQSLLLELLHQKIKTMPFSAEEVGYRNAAIDDGRRFGVQPREKTSAWRKIPAHIDLKNILCRRYQRTVNNDNIISVDAQIIQLMPTASHLHLVKAKVIVNRWLDGSWHIYHREAGEVPCNLFELSLNKLGALG